MNEKYRAKVSFELQFRGLVIGINQKVLLQRIATRICKILFRVLHLLWVWQRQWKLCYLDILGLRSSRGWIVLWTRVWYSFESTRFLTFFCLHQDNTFSFTFSMSGLRAFIILLWCQLGCSGGGGGSSLWQYGSTAPASTGPPTGPPSHGPVVVQLCTIRHGGHWRRPAHNLRYGGRASRKQGPTCCPEGCS